jgi:DNA-binding FadR family transcriptional regulator
MTIPIQRRKLSQEVVDRLLARFRAGEFFPGSPLPSERQLMKQYGVGRPAVREALLSLSRMGLVAIQHGKRSIALVPSVANIVGQLADLAHFLVAASPKILDQLKEARRHFEEIVVRLASRRASKGDIEKLRLVVEAYQTADSAACFRAGVEFHRQIAAMTGNVLFQELSQVIFALLKRYHIAQFRSETERRALHEGHLRILERIAARDADGAAAAMARHLERAAKRYSVSANRRRTERRKAPAE